MPPTPRPQGPKKKSNVKVPGSADDSRQRLWMIAGAAVLVVVAAALAFVLFGGGDDASTSTDGTAALEAAGCQVTTVKALKSNDHTVLTADGTSTKWNTKPPTSGPHYSTPAIWGIYTEPLLDAQVVHNLEHGGIFVEYGDDVPAATVDQLRGFYDEHRNGTLVAPNPTLGDKIALGVWTTSSPSKPDTGTARLAKCTTFDQAAYEAFFDDYQFNGPERFPASSMIPGA